MHLNQSGVVACYGWLWRALTSACTPGLAKIYWAKQLCVCHATPYILSCYAVLNLVPKFWYRDLGSSRDPGRSWYQDPGNKLLVPQCCYWDYQDDPGIKLLMPNCWSKFHLSKYCYQDLGTMILFQDFHTKMISDHGAKILELGTTNLVSRYWYQFPGRSIRSWENLILSFYTFLTFKNGFCT